MDKVFQSRQKMNVYQLLTDAYYGTGQFEKGDGLLKHPRESENNYQRRKELAYYLNYTGSIVNSAVDPVFRKEIRRDYRDTLKLATFLDDVDRSGADLQDYMRRMATYAKLYGVVYVIVNNESEHYATEELNVKYRAIPYLTYVLPQDVVGWEFDDRNKLSSFSYKTKIKTDANEYETRITTWTADSWMETTEGGEVVAQGANNIHVLPVVQWFSRSTDVTEILPPSEYISIAQTNFHLYQLCSWHTQLLRDQAFSVLTMPSDNLLQDVTVGTNNLLLYPTDATHTPSYIAPSAAPAQMLTDQIDRLIKEMYRMSGLDSVVGVQLAKSGVAKQWDFEKTNQKLADFAAQCEGAEIAIMKLYELWTGESIDFYCEYPRDFKINDTSESLGQAQQALELGINSDTYKIEVARKVLDAYLPSLEDDVYERILKELEEVLEEESQAVAYMHESIEDDTEDASDGDVDETKANKDR